MKQMPLFAFFTKWFVVIIFTLTNVSSSCIFETLSTVFAISINFAWITNAGFSNNRIFRGTLITVFSRTIIVALQTYKILFITILIEHAKTNSKIYIDWQETVITKVNTIIITRTLPIIIRRACSITQPICSTNFFPTSFTSIPNKTARIRIP